MNAVSNWIIPSTMAFILCYGLFKKVDIFQTFLEGAKEGITTSIQILPALVALMTGVGMFQSSGALDVLSNLLSPVTDLCSIPKEVIPLALLRPISGSGSLVVFEDLLSTHGAESMIGRIASVLQGSTETTFYTIAVYFSAAKISKTRYTLFCALAADLTGFIMSSVCVHLFF
jgi:spore maturation protein B